MSQFSRYVGAGFLRLVRLRKKRKTSFEASGPENERILVQQKIFHFAGDVAARRRGTRGFLLGCNVFDLLTS